MSRKIFAILFCTIFLLSLISAQANKIEISIIGDKTIEAGGNLNLKVSIYDAKNNPINDNVALIFEDETKKSKIEKTITSGKITDISLDKQAIYGGWTVTAKYENLEAKESFNIKINEKAEFKLEGDKLIIKNIGNTKYTKRINIEIGDTRGSKQPDLSIGEETSFRLIAPDGVYNIKITDGTTSLTQGDVKLTGKAIGILDENIGEGSAITGGIRPEDENSISYEYLKKSKFVYVFVLAILGAMILLAIERRYKKK